MHIEGKLITNRFRTSDGKHRTTSKIMAGELHILENAAAANKAGASGNASDADPIDENSIEILGHINTGISGDNFRSFSFASVK